MMKRCSIVRAADPPPLSDAVDGTPWTTASWVELDEFPWGKTGRSPSTTVRPLYDDEAPPWRTAPRSCPPTLAHSV